jgi:hypothetical protein
MDEFERVGSREFELLDLAKFKVSQYPVRRICVRKGHMLRRRKPADTENPATQIYPDGVLMSFMEQRTLLEAAEGGHADVVWMVLTRSDVRPDFSDGDGRTALSLAVGKGHEAIVQMLLARNDVNPEVVNAEGLTVLSLAASRGLDSIVKLLLKSGKTAADTKSRSDITKSRSDITKSRSYKIIRLVFRAWYKTLINH